MVNTDQVCIYHLIQIDTHRHKEEEEYSPRVSARRAS